MTTGRKMYLRPATVFHLHLLTKLLLSLKRKNRKTVLMLSTWVMFWKHRSWTWNPFPRNAVPQTRSGHLVDSRAMPRIQTILIDGTAFLSPPSDGHAKLPLWTILVQTQVLVVTLLVRPWPNPSSKVATSNRKAGKTSAKANVRRSSSSRLFCFLCATAMASWLVRSPHSPIRINRITIRVGRSARKMRKRKRWANMHLVGSSSTSNRITIITIIITIIPI